MDAKLKETPADNTSATGSGGDLRYPIRTVAQLTGLTVDTLRTWERRHQVVVPERGAGGVRLYDEPSVQRLKLLRSLTELGYTVGQLAKREPEELRELLEKHRKLERGSQAAQLPRSVRRSLELVVFGEGVSAQLSAHVGGSADVRLRRVGSLDELHQLEGMTADALVVELELLGEQPRRTLGQLDDALRVELTVIVYQHAAQRDLEALAGPRVRLVRQPLRAVELVQLLRDAVGILPPAERRPQRSRRPRNSEATSAPQFSSAQLARLQELPSSVLCECPSHLAALVATLSSFEEYCKRCIDIVPEEQELHADILEDARHARARMEEALRKIMAHEGIS